MLWNVLDLHIEDIDKRNMVEVFENILNSLWLGVRMYVVEFLGTKTDEQITTYMEDIKDYLDKNTHQQQTRFWVLFD